ncbi:intraflagellar transport protein 20 homolog isoform X2 [Betta splendens]|uniref:Intraflagellar transport protein 20 homolog isoform X2 n=1 Tax=Betta splendens TaxID=158456 RepID=A0A8M1HLP1_BETSP|nr:intraflagellar transport protein 20 homolog isoform X2 [Betta splendens]
MAKTPLAEAGFYFDELNKLRVLEPDVSQKTLELKEECKEFVDKIGQFQEKVGGLIELVDELAKEAETEKMKAIGARNLLKSVAKQREAQQQQLQALIAEKKMQLESIPRSKLCEATVVLLRTWSLATSSCAVNV